MDEYPIDSVPLGSVENVYTTHVTHQELFYVHIESRSKILDDIMANLDKRYRNVTEGDKVLTTKRQGCLCAAKFTDDGFWYRAKITRLIGADMIEVQFVDYGNTDFVSEDRVKVLDPDLVQFPVQSYKCALAGVSSSQDFWPPELMVQFEDIVIDKRCKAIFKGTNADDVYLVEMYNAEGVCLNQVFGASKLGSVPAIAEKGMENGHETRGFRTTEWKIGDKLESMVVYISSPSLFWCQDLKYSTEIIVLSEKLSRLHMTQEITPLSNISPGTVCAARFHEDRAWYRGIVQSVSKTQAKVYFVDFGNVEFVDLDSICGLRPDLMQMPALAVKCCLANLPGKGQEWSPECIEAFETLVLDREFEVNVVNKVDDTFMITLLDIEKNEDVADQLQPIVNKYGGVKNSSPDTYVNKDVNSNCSSVASSDPGLTVGSVKDVFLTWVNSPGDFWVQCADSTELVESMSEQLQAYYSQPRAQGPSHPGSLVVAKFSEDQLWYRGLVLKVNEEEAEVLFIDYGNSDIVLKAELKKAASQLGQVHPMAQQCSLAGVRPLHNDNTWSADAKDFLEKLTEHGCQCRVVGKRENHLSVQLSVNGKDLAQELTSLAVVAESRDSGHKQKSPVPMFTKNAMLQRGQSENVTVTFVDSPHSFWCQLARNYTDINSLMDKLEAHYSDEGGTPVSKPVLGQACIAQYSADNAWYRATLTNTSSQGFDVHFIDFGNTETVSPHGVCIPEPKFLDLPTQAVQCSLSLVGDLNHLSDILTDLILEKELTLKVLDFHGDLAVVELYDGNQLVSEMLKSAQSSASVTAPVSTGLKFSPAKTISVGATVTAFTSVVVSPSKFFLQMAGIDEELAILMDNIASRYTSGSELGVTNPAAGQDCVAKYSEDDQWYRGKILSVQNGQCTVLFVDYGNEENISMASIKALNPECASVPIMAYECSLHGIESRSWSEKAVEFFESLVMDKELCCTFVTPSKVKLSSEGHDIATQLVDAGYTQAERTVKPADTIAGDDVGASSSFGSRRSGEGGVKAGFGRDYGETKERSSQNVEDSGGFGRKTGDLDRGGRNSFGGRASGFGGGRHDDDEEKVGFRDKSSGFGGSRHNDDEEKVGFGDRSSGFGGGGGRRGGDREGGSGFGGGRRDRKATSDSDGNESTTFTYADPPSEPEKAVLVHMDDDGTFYLQLLSMEKEILFLARRLAGSYKGGSGPRMREAAAEGSVCCGKFPGDGSMYRCSVEGVQGNKILVRYMDYGNTAECTPYDLKFLFPDLLQYPVQAFPCKLRGLEWSLDQGEKFAAATLDKDLEVTFTTTTKPFEVEIKTPDGDLLDIMTGKIVPKPSPKSSSFETGSKTSPKGFGGFGSKTMNENESPKSLDKAPSRQVPKQEFKSQSVLPGEHSAYISHVGEDGYFYLQLEKDTETLDSVSDKLVGLPAGDAHPNITTGAACAAVYSEDSSWYRAAIYSKDGDRLKVTFVDYGNGDTVDSTSIKPLNEELLSSAPMAYQCQFPDVGPLAVELRDKVSEYLTDHQMTVTFQSKEAPFEVSITTVDGEDFREIICPSSNYRSQPVPKGVLPVSVSHMELENDGKFFLQLFRDYNTVKEIQDALSADYGLECEEKMENPEVGSPCCVKRDDGLWYRGKIVKIDDGSIDVFHVDFGYTSSVDCSCLRTLQAKHLKKAPQALECRLKGVETWTESLKEKFVDMTQDKVLNATFFSDTPPYRVSLARSIELDLLGLNSPLPDSPTRLSAEKQGPVITGDSSVEGERSYMPHVETDGTFYVQTVVREQDLYAMTEKLEEALASATELTGVEVGAHVCAKFTEDDSWYRATVEGQSDEEKYSVRFVDYGNTDVVGTDRLAAIPEGMDLNLISPFASKCQFAGVSLGLTQEQVDQLRNLVADQIVTVIFRSKGDNVELVDVALNGKQLTETLGLSQDVEVTENIEAKEEDEFEDAVENFEESDSVNPEMGLTTNDSEVSGGISDFAAVSLGQRVAVTVSYLESPDMFYFQLETNQGLLDQLMNSMYEHFSSLQEGEGLTEKVDVGDWCAALYHDESWYRGKVEAVKEDGSYQIRFIDYGNVESVTITGLRSLPNVFMGQPCMCRVAKLAGVSPVGTGWTDEAVADFRTMVEEKSLLADIVRLDEEQCCVHLLELGISVHQELIKKGHATASSEDVAVSKSVQQVFSDTNESLLAAKSLNLSDCLESTHLDGDEETAKQAMMTLGAHVDEDQDQGISPQDIVNLNTHTRQKISCISNSLNELEEVEVYVCHSENPSAFWCQLASSTDALEDLSSSLADTYQSPEEADRVLGSLNPSDIVVAVFSEDEQLYRSEVLASSHIPSADEPVSEEKVSVQFVDYGNKSEVYRNQVYKIRDSLCKLPRQAFCCCLDGIQPVGSEWTADSCERFSDLVRDHKLSLKLVGRKEVGVALVELVLLESSRCVSSMLVEEAHASLVARTAKDLNASSILRGANLSAMDSLEISQPIMESTAMVENISNQVQTFSYEADSNSQYRYLCLSLHTEYDVTVSNCELPNGFHVQLNALQNQFSSLMAELAEYVVSDAFEEKADFIPELHAPVLVQKCGVWYRGLVKSIDEEECTVLAVDCGWELTIPQQTLTALPERFLDLPAQAVSCYLAGVVSVEPAWCTGAITFFSDCVKNCKMCIYVLENAEDGKYGVYMSDLDSTTTQSLNRAMVDLGYADVVPGSNIEVQIEMEKTLDTELLSDLEASFNEVKDQKENAYDDNGKEAGTSRASSDNLLKDTNKDYFSNSLESAEENLFHLIPSSHGRDSGPSAIEGAHTTASGDTEKGSDHHHHHHQEFSLSSVVERIDKLGLVDAYFDEPCMPPLDEVEESDISGTDVPAVVTPVNEASPQSDANADQVSAATTQAKSLYTWKHDAESKDAKTSDSEGRPLESEAEGDAESESDRSKESLGNSCQDVTADEMDNSDPPSCHKDTVDDNEASTPDQDINCKSETSQQPSEEERKEFCQVDGEEDGANN